MASDWQKVIPSDLHENFTRQVEEAVSAELMQVFLNGEDSSGVALETDDIEEQLAITFRAKYLEAFRKGQWPPKASAQLGVKPTATESHHWVCSGCKERNQNSFETCQRCSEERPSVRREPVALPASTVRAATAQAAPRPSAGWTCRECNSDNAADATECASCYQHVDPYRRSTWPTHGDVPEATMRQELRMRLFHALRDEFDMDDPFSSIDISHEEFFLAIDRLKRDLLSSVAGGAREELIDL